MASFDQSLTHARKHSRTLAPLPEGMQIEAGAGSRRNMADQSGRNMDDAKPAAAAPTPSAQGRDGSPGVGRTSGFRQWLWREIVEWARFLVWAAPAFLAFSTVGYSAYRIPSESMVPSLEVGDRIAVAKWAYGYSRYSLPFGAGLLPQSEHRIFERMPRRGDVVVFIHPQHGQTMIKRLVGLPGDRIEVRDGVLWINAVETATTFRRELVRKQRGEARGVETVEQFSEALPDGPTHLINNQRNDAEADNFGPVVVPENAFFMMGDNRDNSIDSRYSDMGFVPRENLIGRAETVFLTTRFCFGADGGAECPRPRLFRPLSPGPGKSTL